MSRTYRNHPKYEFMNKKDYDNIYNYQQKI